MSFITRFIEVGPFVFVAIIVATCLVLGVGLSVYAHDVPSLVVAVVLACAVTSFLYGILGNIGTAGFEAGPFQIAAGAVVLIGGTYLFNMLLAPQFEDIRDSRGRQVLEGVRFDFNRHVVPAEGWFAIDRETAAPVVVKIIDPVNGETAGEIKPPARVNAQLELKEQQGGGGYLVSGVNSGVSLGYVTQQNIESILGPLGGDDARRDMIDLEPEIIDMEPGTIHGPKRLYLVNSGRLPPDRSREWGNCADTRLPLSIRVKRFADGYADYEVRSCGSDEVIESRLRRRQGELHKLKIGDELRSFVVLLVAANHQTSPFWSSFVVVEVVQPDS